MKEFFDINLIKWPALIVKGESVTPEQAAEIIIRTNAYPFCSNDREFEVILNNLMFGVPKYYGLIYGGWNDSISREEIEQVHKQIENKLEELKVLDIVELHNHQIVSSWIGGAHGWWKWDGTIFTNNYNIGKWPEVETVYEDWVKISEAFPFLNLKCQLLNKEAGDDEVEAKPLIEFVVKDGKVSMNIPTDLIVEPVGLSAEDFAVRFNATYGERGIHEHEFEKKFRIYRHSLTLK